MNDLSHDDAVLINRRDLDRAIDALLAPFDRSDAPGLVVAVHAHGRERYRRGVGMASVQHGIANTPATRMRIGSTSKQFTCLAALLLCEDRLLDLDAPINDFLPEAPCPRGAPTLRQLMNHTSGYRCTLDMGTLANGWARQPLAWQFDAFCRQREVNFAPGVAQMYCNGTYRALSVIIERLAGTTFAAFLRTRILEPLGMYDTEHVPSDDTMVPGLAAGHVASPDGGWMRGPVDTDSLGEGGLVSTAADLARWMAHLRHPKIVGSDETWRRMLEPTVLANGVVSPYGLGIKRTSYRGVDVLHHSGAVTGFNSQILVAPAHALDIVVLVNGAAASASRIAEQILERALGDDAMSAPSSRPSSDLYRHLIGRRYRSGDGLVLAFDDIDGTLGIGIANMARSAPLIDRGDDVAVGFDAVGQGPYAWRRGDLAPVDSAAPPTLPIRISGEPALLERLDPPGGGTVADGVRHGRYWSPDLLAEAEIVRDRDRLVLSLRGDYSAARTFDLEPFSATTFGAVDRFSPDDRYVLDYDARDPRAPGFWIDTFRARRIRFDFVAVTA